jgi:arsenite methyltransferase
VVKGMDAGVSFQEGDAERLPVADASFDAVICECAFCTFPDKPAAAQEFARVLRTAGRVGLSDLTRGLVLPKELDGLLAWIACIADAQPVDRYVQYLSNASFRLEHTEQHDEVRLEMVQQVRIKLLGTEIMVGLKKLHVPSIALETAKQTAQAALAAIQKGNLGYANISAAKVEDFNLSC